MKNFVEENEIRICIGEEKRSFSKRMCKEINLDFESAYKNCIHKNCHFLRGKYLYPCPVINLHYENQDILEMDITKEMVEKNSINLINGFENGWEILCKCVEPTEFCKHCSTNLEWFEWRAGEKIKKEDWIVGIDNNRIDL